MLGELVWSQCYSHELIQNHSSAATHTSMCSWSSDLCIGKGLLCWPHLRFRSRTAFGWKREKSVDEGEERGGEMKALHSSHGEMNRFKRRKLFPCLPFISRHERGGRSLPPAAGGAIEQAHRWGGWSRWRAQKWRDMQGVGKCEDSYLNCLHDAKEKKNPFLFFILFCFQYEQRVWCNIYVNFRSAASEMYICVWTRSACLCRCEIANDFRAYLVINTEALFSMCVYI